MKQTYRAYRPEMVVFCALVMIAFAGRGFADTEAQILGWRTPGSGQSPMVVTTPTVIALQGWRYGEIRLKRPQSCYWIDANGDGSFALADDVALTSAGLWVKGSLVAGALGIEVGDGGTTFTHTISELFLTSGTLMKVEVVDNGTSAVAIRIGLTQEAETSITQTVSVPDLNTSLSLYLRRDGSNSPTGAIDWDGQDLTGVSLFEAETIRSNGHIYVNYDGPDDGNDSIYFYEDGSPTGERMYFDDGWDAFRFTDALYAEGYFISPSGVMASLYYPYSSGADYLTFGNYAQESLLVLSGSSKEARFYGSSRYSKYGGGDGTQALYFYEDGSPIGEYLSWDDGDDRFEFSDEVLVSQLTIYATGLYLGYGSGGVLEYHGQNASWAHRFITDAGSPTNIALFDAAPHYIYMQANGNVRCTGVFDSDGTGDNDFEGSLLIGGTSIKLNDNGGDGDSFLYFYEDGSATGESFKWDDGDDRFELTDDLYLTEGEIIGYATDGELLANRLNHVAVGDDSTTVPETRKLRFDSTWFSVSDEGSSGALVEFVGVSGTYTATDTVVVRKEIYQETLTAVGRFDVAIPQTYDHLEIKLVGRSDVSDVVDHVAVWLNDDSTAANYRRTAHYGGSGHGSGVSNDSIIASIPADSSVTGDFGSAYITIYDYTNTSRNKDLVSVGTERQDASAYYSRFYTVNWESTNAITTVTLHPDGWSTDQFATGTAIWICGVKEIDVITDIAVGGMDGITTGNADLRYLKLDASNDPITGDLGLSANLYLNEDGPEGDSYLYFYDGGSPTGKYLKWDNANTHFDLNANVIASTLLSRTDAYLKVQGPEGDSALYFWNSAGPAGESLLWDDSEDRFQLSDDLRVTGNVRAANVTVAGRLLAGESGFPSFSDGDATPDLSTNESVGYYTANTGATTITDFDNPTHGQIIIVIAGDGNTTISDNANIILAGSTNWTMGADDTLTLLYDDNAAVWYEISRSDN